MLSVPLAVFGLGTTELIILGGIFLLGSIAVVAAVVIVGVAAGKGRRDE